MPPNVELPSRWSGFFDLKLGLQKLCLKVLEAYDLILSKLTRNNSKERYITSNSRADSGSDVEQNLITLCADCHAQMHRKDASCRCDMTGSICRSPI